MQSDEIYQEIVKNPNSSYFRLLKGYLRLFLIISILLCLNVFSLYSQVEEAKQKQIKKDGIIQSDTASSPIIQRMTELEVTGSDTNTVLTKSEKKSNSGIDTTVFYYARDSVRFKVKDQILRLRGEAKLQLKQQKLESEIIQLKFKSSALDASGVIDSSGRWTGFPKFYDMGEEFAGERILYNFKSNQGTISLGETQMSEGFYFGTKIKRVSVTESFIEKGYYTTCDAPEPHFHFGSPKMKFIAGDRIFLDPLIFYVADMPIFMFPFGLFFPSQGGRQSGFVVPSFFFSRNRGVVFEDFGFYFALSDYYDTKFSANFYSKGGYNIKNSTRWKLLNEFNGSLDASYGKTRMSPENPYQNDWNFRLFHNHTINPQERIDVNLSFSSQDFFRNTSNNIGERITQNITSNASYSKSFDNRSSIALSYQRFQNIIDDSYKQDIPFSFQLPSYNPFAKLVSSSNILRDFSFSYSGSALYHSEKNVISSAISSDTASRQYEHKEQKLIRHNPNISISPKFGYFTVQPSVSLGANNYFRRLQRVWNSNDSIAVDSFEQGFYTEYRYSFSLNLSTKLFGVLTAQMLGAESEVAGIRAFRHTYQPTLGFSYTPDMSGSNYGFYDTYYDEKNKRTVQYSRYEADGGGIAPRSLSSALNYSDMHSFEIKIASKDTMPDVNLELLRISTNTSYNFAAESFKLRDFNTLFSSKALGFINLNGNAAFTFYDQERVFDSIKQEFTDRYQRIDKYLLSQGKGLARLTNFNIQLSAAFSSKGIAIGSQPTTITESDKPKDSISLGERFRLRQEHTESQSDIFGDNTPGYNPISAPWNVDIGVNFGYENSIVNRINRSLIVNANLSLNLTPTWRLTSGAQYDFINEQLLIPTMNITKDMHCWQLSVRWTPTGYNQGFYLRFGVKASHLQDLQLEKQSSPLIR